LFRKYLHSGAIINGQRYKTLVSTLQRGLRFVRYSYDCVITVGSEAAAKRMMYSVSRFIEKRLGLKINMIKTVITKPSELKYLGFGF